ncbi:MAG: hypothetical protein R3228_04255 [Halioglobus sp.]|nr:hypothetical protein [Halioglobus sp.]
MLSAQAASAGNVLEEVIWVPQVGVQWKKLDFEQALPDPGSSEGDVLEGSLDANVPSMVVSFTGIYKKAYVSFKYEDSLDNVSTDSDVPGTNGPTDTERKDFSITVGYNVWDRLNVFAGYLEGETKLRPDPTCPADLPGGVQVDNPDCGRDPALGAGPQRTLNGNLAQDHFVNQQAGFPVSAYKQEYKEDGWFLGASYGWRLMDTGTLSVSLAYADLDATYTDNYLVGTGFPDVYDYDGNADGFSYGINWSQPLSEKVGYYLDLRTQQYEADLEDQTGAFLDVENEEKITAFTAGIQLYL